MRAIKIIIAAVLLAAISLVYAKIEFDISGDFEGVFVLAGGPGKWWEITDDLFPEDANRLTRSFNFTYFKHVVSNTMCKGKGSPCMHYEWNKDTGRGFIKTVYPDGAKFLICLSRYRIDNKLSSGLFLGGGLAPSDPDSDIFDREEASMAFFDGRRYYHIWCNSNESIIDGSYKLIDPPEWEYLGSEVLENSSTDLTIVSRHKVLVNKVPVAVERYMFYEAGDTHITLTTKIKNIGQADTEVGYAYGDEPWVGNYGSSEGDIGWLKDRLVTTEMNFDTKANSYAGIFDYGNELAGEKHVYTRAANFIEWQPDSRPDAGYFSNNFGKVASPEEHVPLSSDQNRVISLQWDKRRLKPNETFSFTIAVGMARYNPQTQRPVKPETHLR